LSVSKLLDVLDFEDYDNNLEKPVMTYILELKRAISEAKVISLYYICSKL
jgi:hypothetical protein